MSDADDANPSKLGLDSNESFGDEVDMRRRGDPDEVEDRGCIGYAERGFIFQALAATVFRKYSSRWSPT